MKRVVLAAVAAICLAGVPKQKPVRPVIVYQHTIHPTNCQDQDPLMPVCTITQVVVENRAFSPVTATLVCGADEAVVNLPARTRLTIDVEMSLYVADAKCSIK